MIHLGSQFSRDEEYWVKVPLPDTQRYIFTKKLAPSWLEDSCSDEDEDDEDNFYLMLTQPSDCLALNTAVTSTCKTLHVWCNDDLMQFVNGPAEDEPPETWHKAIRHLLSVYQPEYLYLHLNDVKTGIMEDFTVDLDGDNSYRALWDSDHEVLYLIRYEHNFVLITCFMLFFV